MQFSEVHRSTCSKQRSRGVALVLADRENLNSEITLNFLNIRLFLRSAWMNFIMQTTQCSEVALVRISSRKHSEQLESAPCLLDQAGHSRQPPQPPARRPWRLSWVGRWLAASHPPTYESRPATFVSECYPSLRICLVLSKMGSIPRRARYRLHVLPLCVRRNGFFVLRFRSDKSEGYLEQSFSTMMNTIG